MSPFRFMVYYMEQRMGRRTLDELKVKIQVEWEIWLEGKVNKVSRVKVYLSGKEEVPKKIKRDSTPTANKFFVDLFLCWKVTSVGDHFESQSSPLRKRETHPRLLSHFSVIHGIVPPIWFENPPHLLSSSFPRIHFYMHNCYWKEMLNHSCERNCCGKK